MEFITYDVEDKFVIITINRPQFMTALNRPVLDEL